MTDHEIWKLFTAGKQVKAISEAYKATFQSTYRYIYSRVGNTQDSEDICSEVYKVFVNVFENYNQKSTIQTFVIGIAINKIRQFWQKKKESHEIQLNPDLDVVGFYGAVPVPEETDFEQETINDEFIDTKATQLKPLLDEVFSQMSEKYCNVLRYTFQDQLSDVEIAKLFSITAVNVRVLRHRALKKAMILANKLMLKKNAK